jgi:hypothetical protein
MADVLGCLRIPQPARARGRPAAVVAAVTAACLAFTMFTMRCKHVPAGHRRRRTRFFWPLKLAFLVWCAHPEWRVRVYPALMHGPCCGLLAPALAGADR